MYIAYNVKNGIEYAKLCVSTRDGEDILKEYTNLGRVLDKELGIYRKPRRFHNCRVAPNSHNQIIAPVLHKAANRANI